MKNNNFFKLGQNGERITFNKLKEELSSKDIESNPIFTQLFSIFDKDKNNVLNKNEIEGIWNTLNMYATSNENNVLDSDEAIEFLDTIDIKISNVNIKALHQFLRALQPQTEKNAITPEQSSKQSQTPPQITLTDEQAKNQVVSALASDVSSAYALYQNQHNGIVTKGYDTIKNYFDSDLGSSNVEEVLALQDEAVNFLLGAQEGSLSKKEYYLENVDHLKKMIKRRLFVKEEASGISFIDRYRDSYSEKQLEQIVDNYLNKYISNLGTIENIKNIQARLTQCTEEGNQAFLEKFLQDALNTPQSGGKTPDNIGVKDSYNIGMSIPIEYNSDEPVTFEEVFKLERGREYNKEKVEEYLNHQAESSFVISAYNNYQTFALNVKKLENETDINNLANKTVELFENNFSINAFEKLKSIINKNNLPIYISQSENGEIELDITAFKNNQETGLRSLKNIAKIAVQTQKDILKDIIGGEAEDKLLEIQQRSELLYEQAYGNDFPESLVQAMKNDNAIAIEKYTGVATTGGMLMLVAGTLLAIPTGGTSLIALGSGMAMGGMGTKMALSTTEHFSKDLVTSEEQKQYRDMMITNAGGLLIGMGAGKLGDKLFNKFVDKKLVEIFNQAINNGNRTELVKEVLTNSELLGKFLKAGGIKVVADFALSLTGDLAMMGAFDTNEDWQSLVKANLVGILMSTGSDVGNLSKGFKTNKITPDTNRLEGLQDFAKNAQQQTNKTAEYTQRKSPEQIRQNDNLIEETQTKITKQESYGDPSSPHHEKIIDNKLKQRAESLVETLNRYDEDSWYNLKLSEVPLNDKIISFANSLLYLNDVDLIKNFLRNIDEVNISLAEKLCSDTSSDIFGKEDSVFEIIEFTNKDNISFAEKLYNDPNVNLSEIANIIGYVNKDNISFAEKLYNDPNVDLSEITDIIGYINKNNISFAEKLYNNKEFPLEIISNVIANTNNNNIILAQKLCADKEFPKEHIAGCLKGTRKDNIQFVEKLCADKNFPKNRIEILSYANNKNLNKLAEILCEKQEISINSCKQILGYITMYDQRKDVIPLIEKILLCSKEFLDDKFFLFILDLKFNIDNKIKLAQTLFADNEFPKEYIGQIIHSFNEETNLSFAQAICRDKGFPKEHIANILSYTNKKNISIAQKLCKDKEFPKELIAKTIRGIQENNISLAKELCADKEFPKEYIGAIVNRTNDKNYNFAKKLCKDIEFPKEHIADVLLGINEETIFFAEKLYTDKGLPIEIFVGICAAVNKANLLVAEKLYANKEFPKEHIGKVLKETHKYNISSTIKLCEQYSNLEIPIEKLLVLIRNNDCISHLDTKKLINKMGKDNVKNLSDEEFLLACQMVDIYHVKNINEIPQSGKKELLRRLVKCNEGMFKATDKIKEAFPLIPINKDAYCTLLPSIVRSLGIETNTLKPDEVDTFNKSISETATSLAMLSDNDFANLNITQEMPKDDFIKLVLEKTKELPSKERQKVYDYFGFELHHSKKNKTGYTITGYPVNLNNGKKLAQITNPNTKEVVELLRPDVIKFSENNKVKCDNPEIENLLNEIVDVLPELRVQLGKPQHSTHSYDVLKHSLKVMQKIAQDPKFEKLNEDDKKIMLLASLLHDVTKREGSVDKTHANESSFDTFFIAKKFNLPREQELKLYTLIKHHEWLEYVNTSRNNEELSKRLQSVAFDLQHKNLFDMALMFSHADLRAVKTDDTFHNTTIGQNRISFDGTVRSYGESADVYAKRIQNYIQELQKSQPLLPVTKIPTASRISDAITVVRPDGSTNIKGIYKDIDGLIIIKYNEVDDWEAIGFPKGSISRGIEAKKGINYGDEKLNEDVNTGNIKFFAHGLDYENQLAKFDAFSLVDSDVLLSISYAERPESKYRFFRPQGVLLDFDTKHVHGGGNSDSGSGRKKNIADFKKDYIFGNKRETDRRYVSDLIKNATGMKDAEYIKFIKTNENKPLSEIEPIELREAIIRAFASINSNTRKGAREYNEMYGSNPKEVMAVFAYSVDYTEKLGNPLGFLNRTTINPNERHSLGNAPAKSVSERTEFLRRYALEHDIPFVIFGD